MRKSISVSSLIFADTIGCVLRMFLYFLALAPIVLIWPFISNMSPLGLILVGLVLWYVAALFFIFGVAVLHHLLVRNIKPGRYKISGKAALKWLFSDIIYKGFRGSLFFPTILHNTVLRSIFFKLIGAKVHPAVLIGKGVDFPDPWALKLGNNVTLGDQVILSGHMVQGDLVSIGDVVIDEGALVGARSLIFPDVVIGKDAVVGAGSVVLRGTVIGPGETWGGNPAVKLQFGRKL